MTSAVQSPPDLSGLYALVSDADFWDQLRKQTEKRLLPIMRQTVIAGARAGVRNLLNFYELGDRKTVAEKAARPKRRKQLITPSHPAFDFLYKWNSLSTDLGYLNHLFWPGTSSMVDVITSTLISDMIDKTLNTLQEKLREAEAENLGPDWVAEQMRASFDQRGQAMAITETNRFFGSGAVQSYKRAGVKYWRWSTVNDPWVDQRCRDLEAQNALIPIEIDFYPAHPRCRCFPVAVPIEKATELLAAATIQLKYNPGQPRDHFGKWASGGGYAAFGDPKKDPGAIGAYSDALSTGDLTARETATVKEYTGSSYKQINSSLRGTLDAPLDFSRDIEAIDSAIAKGTFKEGVVLHRGVSFKQTTNLNNLKPGAILSDAGYSSLSASEDIAFGHATKNGLGAVLEVRVPAGVNGLPLWQGDRSRWRTEYEVLMPRGSSFRLVSNSGRDEFGVTRAVVELVP